jgi:hypothetical protein
MSLSPKDLQQRKIYDILEKIDSPFDRSISDILNQYEAKFEENKKWMAESQAKIDEMVSEYYQECEEAGEDVYVEPPDTSMDYIEAVYENNGAHYFHESWCEELMAISELKIIYGFKQIEIALKKFLLIFEDGIDLKSVQRWDDLKRHFNQMDVKISEVSNYKEINELRQVNNALKHSHKVTESVKTMSIVEFKDKDYFTHDSLLNFYNRVYCLRDVFIKGVAQKLAEKYA